MVAVTKRHRYELENRLFQLAISYVSRDISLVLCYESDANFFGYLGSQMR